MIVDETETAETATDEVEDSGSEDRTATETASEAFEAITSQADFDARLKGRLTRAEKAAEKKSQKAIDDLNAKVKSFEDAQLSVDEKKDKTIADLTAALAERDKTISQKDRNELVTTLAADNNLPRKFWDRVRGETEDEITADIAELLEALPAATVTKTGPPSQSATVKVQTTGDDGEQNQSADDILASISDRWR